MEDENSSSNGQRIKRKLSNNDESRSVMPKYGNDENNQEKYDSLPDDILIQVIKYLPITQWPDLELVDRKFQQAVYGAWRTIRKIRLTEDFVTNRIQDPNEILKLILEKLINRSPYLISICDIDIYSGDDWKAIDENAVQLLGKFQHLERLSIFGKAAITVTNLAQFLETSKCRSRLKELNVYCSYVSDGAQSQEAQAQLLSQVFGNIRDRSTLKLDKFDIELSTEEVASPSNFFDFLNVINVDLLTKLDVFQCQIDSDDLARLIDRCVHLENLAFNFYSSEECQDDHPDRFVSLFEAFKVLENLTVLSIGFKKLKWTECYDCYYEICSNFEELCLFFGRHRRITQLSLIDINYGGVIDAIENISSHLTSLTLLLAIYCSIGESVVNLMPKLVNLKKLHIRGLVLSEGPEYGVLPSLTENKPLEYLHLDTFKSTCGGIESIDFNVLTQFENLKELRIHKSCFHGKDFDFWIDQANWKLQSLAIPNFQKFRCPPPQVRVEEKLLSFLQKMPGLRRLDLSNNEIMDIDLEVIAKICPLLIDLKLNDCKLITINGVQKIIDGCADLKKIEIPQNIQGLKVNKYRNIKFIYND